MTHKLLGRRFRYVAGKRAFSMSDDALAARDEFSDRHRGAAGLVPLDCFCCGESAFDVISEIDRYGFFYPTGVCRTCGFVQQSTYYDEQTLRLFYEQYYPRIYGRGTPADLHALQRRSRGNRVYDFIHKRLTPRRVLEVGCSAGGVLISFHEGGSSVFGVDLDPECVAYAQSLGMEAAVGSVDAVPSGETFDLIILSHVLEHVTEPKTFLANVAAKLSDDGTLYIEVPSLESIRNGACGHDLLRYWQNAHVSHFTMKTLANVCAQVGLRNVACTEVIESCWVRTPETLAMPFAGDETNRDAHALLRDIERTRRRNLMNVAGVSSVLRGAASQLADATALGRGAKRLLKRNRS